MYSVFNFVLSFRMKFVLEIERKLYITVPMLVYITATTSRLPTSRLPESRSHPAADQEAQRHILRTVPLGCAHGAGVRLQIPLHACHRESKYSQLRRTGLKATASHQFLSILRFVPDKSGDRCHQKSDSQQQRQGVTASHQGPGRVREGPADPRRDG